MGMGAVTMASNFAQRLMKMGSRWTSAPSENPFRAGSGTPPPYLAGRDTDIAVFKSCMDSLYGKGAVPHGPMVLFAPRGNGKTVLMRRMVDLGRRNRVNVVALDPSDIETAGQVKAQLARIAGGKGVLKTKATRAHGQIGTDGAGVELERQTVRDMESEAAAKSLLRIGKKPTLIVIDEAHALATEGGAVLLQAEQSARTEGAKNQLVLAGTPNLQSALDKMHTTFWSRLHNRRRPLGLLGKKDSVDAIAQPMNAEITDGAAELIMQETAGYPYFLQVMGWALWDASPKIGATIDGAAMHQALPQFSKSKADYYRDRINGLQDAGLLFAACAVTETARLRGWDALTDEDIDRACERASAHSDLDAASLSMELKHAGFLWNDETSIKDNADPNAVPPWSCGIPTLSDAVVQRVAVRHPEAYAMLLPLNAPQPSTSAPQSAARQTGMALRSTR